MDLVRALTAGSIRRRLALLLIFANLPAAILALAAAWQGHGAARELKESAVIQRTELAAVRTQFALAVARNVLDTLASDREVVQSGPFCPAILAATLAGRTDYATVAIADADGQVRCRAGQEATFDPGLLSRIARGEAGSLEGALLTAVTPSADHVIIAVRAASTDNPPPRALVLTVRRAALRAALSGGPGSDEAVALIRADGEAIAEVAPRRAQADWKPAEPHPLARADGSTSWFGDGTGGDAFLYVTAPVVGAHATVLAAVPASTISAIDWVRIGTTLGVPLLMLAMAMVVIFIGVDQLVLRWVKRLVAAGKSYGRGDYAPRIWNLDRAPTEIAELASTFNAMAGSVDERSRALNEALAGKNHLLRELHHRVKNNFQMIASLLALQRRDLPMSMRSLLRVPEDRVLAMAAAYRASYATGDIGRVPLPELLRDVVAQLRQSFGLSATRIVPDSDMEGILLDLDRAVPLGMLISELLTAALDRPSGTLQIRLLVERPGAGHFAVSLIAPGIVGTVPDGGLPARLVSAYLAQLDAQVEPVGDDRLRISLPVDAPAAASPGRVELGAG